MKNITLLSTSGCLWIIESLQFGVCWDITSECYHTHKPYTKPNKYIACVSEFFLYII